MKALVFGLYVMTACNVVCAQEFDKRKLTIWSYDKSPITVPRRDHDSLNNVSANMPFGPYMYWHAYQGHKGLDRKEFYRVTDRIDLVLETEKDEKEMLIFGLISLGVFAGGFALLVSANDHNKDRVNAGEVIGLIGIGLGGTGLYIWIEAPKVEIHIPINEASKLADEYNDNLPPP